MFAWWVAAAGYRLAQTRNDTWRRVHSHFSTVQTTWIETKSSTTTTTYYACNKITGCKRKAARATAKVSRF